MKRVSGFLTNDGTYFDTEDEARLYDAMAALTFAATNVGANPKAVFVIVDGCMNQIEEYINAKRAHQKAEHANPFSAEPTASPAFNYTNDGTTETPIPSILEQPPHVDEYVPDVGSGVGAEEIPDISKINGPGIRPHDARSVLSDTPMATRDTTRASWPRSEEGV